MKEKKIFKKWKKLALFGLMGLFLLVQFAVPLRAHADLLGLGEVSLNFVSHLIKGALLLIRDILVAGLMKLAAELTAVSLSLNQTLSSNVADPTSFVYTGWGIFRDLANLGFVFGIILIAIATILRIRSYQAQSILWKLIVAALIVNFSLVICGAILKVSDVFSNFFLQYLTTNSKIDHNSSEQVGSAVVFKMVDKTQFNKIIAGPSVYAPGSTEDKPVFNKPEETKYDLDATDMINVFLQVIMAIFIAFILLVLAVMFLLRYFNLAFLMILVPGAWLLWIFPAAYRYWREWWQHFIKWTFFAPLMLLFIYLSVVAMDKSSSSFTSMAKNVSTAGGPNGITGFESIMLTLMAGAILIGGLKVSQKMGMAGSSFILKQATKARGWAQTKATRGAARVGRGALKFSGLKEATTKWGSKGFGKFVGLGSAARGLARVESAAEKKSQEYIEQKKKDWNSLSSKQLADLLPTMSTEQKAAALEMLSSRGNLSEASGKIGSLSETTGVLEKMESLGRGKEAGDLQKQMGMNLKMMNALKSGDTSKFSEEAAAYYGGFSSGDWGKTASGIGNLAFGEGDMPGMSAEQSGAFKKAYSAGLGSDFGQAMSATTPKLKGKQLREFYKQMVVGVAGAGGLGNGFEEKDVTEEIERPAGFGQTVKEKRASKQSVEINLDKEAQQAIENGDFDRVIQVLSMSSNEAAKRMVQKLKKTMGSPTFVFEGVSEEGKKESSKPSK